MRINHNIKVAKKEIKTNWKKAFYCGVTFKNPYMRGGKPTSYQRLFLEFINIIRQPGVDGASGKELRKAMGWRDGTHSDYFAMFTDNNILKYNRSTRLYEKGENYSEYASYSIAKEKECKQ